MRFLLKVFVSSFHFQTMFELFNVPSMALVPKSTLALYCNGKTTGLVIDSGYETTQVVPIYEGFPLTQAAKSMPVGGRHVTDYLMKLLNDRGYDFKTEEDLDNLREIKRKYCYCALNVEKELAAFGSDQIQRHKLPDGTVIEIHAELLVKLQVSFQLCLFVVLLNVRLYTRTISVIRVTFRSSGSKSCLIGLEFFSIRITSEKLHS